MKKLFLLLAVGFSLSSVAQSSMEANTAGKSSRAKGMIERRKAHSVNPPANIVTPATAGKSSDGVSGEWFCFSDAITVNGVSELAYWPVYPDSNIHTGNFNWYLHGFGTSFDPTSTKFYGQFSNLTPYFPQPSFQVTTTDPYWVDSIGIYGWYERIDFTVVDTLNIYVCYAASPGAFNITWSYTADVQPYWGRADSQLQVASPVYDWQSNSINPDTVTGVIKLTKLLDDAAFADSTYFAPDNTDIHIWNFALPNGGLAVPADANVSVFVTFGSAVNHPLGTDWNLANKWDQLTLAVGGQNGIPNQVPGDYNCGVGAFSDERYHFNNYYAVNNNSRAVLAPTYAYTPVYMSDPWFAFHVKTTASNSEVKKVSSVTEINAYPNPANDKVNISFKTGKSGDAAVTITNVNGQVVGSNIIKVKGGGVASFSTSALPNGVYFYTVDFDGERTTTKFVIER